MTTATVAPATWPTEARYEEAGKALASAYNHVEGILWDLDKLLGPYMAKDEAPDVVPTAETIGLMWSFLDRIQIEAHELDRFATDFEQYLRQADGMRIEERIRAR